ncbi:hypothetical protein MAMC_00261 [Methylacidimicrobium cyclopophantes]|uniref:Uncharacterized protein n=1 Tax=Methylacidimicrobium cyclopophantes TaxID=1041766 RepID=A0A5E6MHB4_9BACT|nr:hypothetical protein [Methylacidimicrobium cyclopophantes]VVM04885.1 hypothetical protein MAMC_00261 [Methylacidimicrobium cyclopophantes]
MSDCEEKCCHEEKSGHHKGAEGCPEEGDLVGHIAQLWKSASCAAWSEVLKEILKEKIRAQWGSQLEKGAEAYVAAAGAGWQAKVAKAKAEAEFRKAIEKSMLG